MTCTDSMGRYMEEAQIITPHQGRNLQAKIDRDEKAQWQAHRAAQAKRDARPWWKRLLDVG